MPSEETQFKTGHPGGPGRPKGSRNKISQAFLDAICADFEEHGADAIHRCRVEKPEVYARLVSGLLPKEYNVGVDMTVSEAITEDEAREIDKALDEEY